MAPKKALITGGTGFIGKKLAVELFRDGYDLVVVSRNPRKAKQELGIPCEVLQWDLMSGPISGDRLQGVTHVVHLAGESIAEGRWTEARKKAVLDSRVLGTRNLMRSLQDMIARGLAAPGAVVSASAIGFYGDRGDETLSEDSTAGEGFLADVCKAWEKESLGLEGSGLPKGVRAAALRLGIVLGRGGGALEKMLPAFAAGAGATLGSGKQWMSWVDVDDVIESICFALREERVSGPLNVVAPGPVTNKAFSQALASALHRPLLLSAPGAALRAGMGEMSVLLLGSQRVLPTRLEALGFRFRHREIEAYFNEFFAEGPGVREFTSVQFVGRPVEEVFPFFSAASNLETITPPFLNFRIVGVSTPEIQEGTLIEYKLRIHGIPVTWQTRIEEWRPNQRFVDVQLRGPYKKWHHTHEFESIRGGTLMRDRVRYELPGGVIGRLVGGAFVEKDVRSIFRYRQEKISELFEPGRG